MRMKLDGTVEVFAALWLRTLRSCSMPEIATAIVFFVERKRVAGGQNTTGGLIIKGRPHQ